MAAFPVNIVKATDFEAIDEAMRLLLKPFQIRSDETVFIKPNVVSPSTPDTGIVTDCRIVSSLIDYLKEKNIEKIVIGEGSALGIDTMKAFEATGFTKLAEDKKVMLIDLNKTERVKVAWKYGEIALPKIVFKSYYINVCKIKMHPQTTVSLSIKNQKGLLSPDEKKHFHQLGLHEPLAQLLGIVKPQLAIIDGIVALEGDGRPKRTDVLLAGDDAVAVDAACCKTIGINPLEVDHIRIAAEIGAGYLETQHYGEEVRVPLQRANDQYWRYRKIYVWWSPHTCSACNGKILEALMETKGKPQYWSKIAFYAFFRGLHLLTGRNPQMPNMGGRIVCSGNCTKAFAEKHGLTYVEGCPPTSKEILENI